MKKYTYKNISFNKTNSCYGNYLFMHNNYPYYTFTLKDMHNLIDNYINDIKNKNVFICTLKNTKGKVII